MDWQNGFILHRRPYRDHSWLVDAFSVDQGRVAFVARAGRGRRTAQEAALQPFTLVNFAISGKSSLKTLKQIETLSQAFPLYGSRLYSGLYVNELLYRLIEPYEADPGLFSQYQQCLLALAKPGSPEPSLRRFEFALLNALGYGVDFTPVKQPMQGAGSVYYLYVNGEGFVPVMQPMKGMLLFTETDLAQLAVEDYRDPRVLRLAKLLCRQLITPLLGNKPLNSRALFLKGKRGNNRE